MKVRMMLIVANIVLLFWLLGVSCSSRLVSGSLGPSSISPPAVEWIIDPQLLTPTPLPTLIPIATPWPTVAHVNADAVAFINTDQTRSGSLWIANVDGSGERKLLDDVSRVAWSPNGRWLGIVYQNGLWVIRPTGENANALIDSDKEHGLVTALAWSPDGSRLAFEQDSNPGYDLRRPARIGIVDIDSGRIAYQTTFSVTDGSILSWSPDGQWLAEWWYGNGRYARQSACLDNSEGENYRSTNARGVTNAVWDPNEEAVYFGATSSNPDNPKLDPDPRLLRLNVDQQTWTRLASLQYDKDKPAYIGSLAISPDGKWLSSTLGKGIPNAVIQITSVDGKTSMVYPLNQPVDHTFRSQDQSWSPDGNHLIFVSDGALYKIDIHTGGITRLTIEHSITAWAASPPVN